MSTSKEERDRILHMVESGQVTATEAAQILDTLESEAGSSIERATERGRDRLLRIRATNLNARAQKVYVTATIPVRLIRAGMRLGLHFMPQINSAALEDMIRTIEGGATGRLLDLQDMEKGERLEIFAEER
ncbi:MAG: hypothetical protein NVS4B11_05130 [Ktedonobacteraceae bacterium]